MEDTGISEPLVLHFDNRVRVAGEVLAGSVDLNFVLAQEQEIDHVRVKVRGSGQTRITRNRQTYHQRIEFVRIDATLWTIGSAFPEPGSHILCLPFGFQLPEDLPSSFYHSALGRRAQISYSIEVIGHRPGIFTRSRRIGQLFPLVSAAMPNEIIARTNLLNGWDSEVRTLYVGSEIRQGLWGHYSRIDAELSFPNLDSLPIATPISFTLRIVTTTKPLKISEVIAQLAKGKAVFPAPPSDPSSINISLDKEIWLKARIARAGRRVDGVNIVPRDCHFIASEPDWINVSELEDGEQIGQYRRVIMLEFIASFGAHPSINTETIKCQYVLRVHVPFPGIGNDLKYDLNLPINSGLGPLRPTTSVGSSVVVQDAPPPFTANVLDLPPSYWAGEEHDWDGDRKS